jgi:sulfane dehydrogenase subunit SoxC
MYNENPLQTGVDFIHGLFSISEWSGVPLKSIFSISSIKKKITNESWLEFTSYDSGSYNISLPFMPLLENGFLALYQNGEPIRPEQGYPVRLIIPGWEGSTHVKWLKSISFRYAPAFTRNETSRYTDLLPTGKSRQYSFFMQSKSIILRPSPGQNVKPGKIIISGLAWSGVSVVEKVDISLDGGKSWNNAELDEKNKNFVRFNFSINWNKEEMIIQSRCKDRTKFVQPSRKEFMKKMGNNAYYHYNAITSWKINADGSVLHVYV